MRLKQCYIPSGRGFNNKGTVVSSNKGSNKSSNAYSQNRKGTSGDLFPNKESHPTRIKMMPENEKVQARFFITRGTSTLH